MHHLVTERHTQRIKLRLNEHLAGDYPSKKNNKKNKKKKKHFLACNPSAFLLYYYSFFCRGVRGPPLRLTLFFFSFSLTRPCDLFIILFYSVYGYDLHIFIHSLGIGEILSPIVAVWHRCYRALIPIELNGFDEGR